MQFLVYGTNRRRVSAPSINSLSLYIVIHFLLIIKMALRDHNIVFCKLILDMHIYMSYILWSSMIWTIGTAVYRLRSTTRFVFKLTFSEYSHYKRKLFFKITNFYKILPISICNKLLVIIRYLLSNSQL